MCNAWNHPPECSCGWGGEGHLGRGTASRLENNQGQKYYAFTGYSSYTNPNARCPVCGVYVFFYQSPEGGRVFFDELGPPWPKHPCTSNNPLGKTTSKQIYHSFSGLVPSYKWEADGWLPFDIDSIKPQPPMFKINNIKGSMKGETLSLYLNLKALTLRAPCLIRKLEDDLYEISTVQFSEFGKSALEVRVKACTLSYSGRKELFESLNQNVTGKTSNARGSNLGKIHTRQKPIGYTSLPQNVTGGTLNTRKLSEGGTDNRPKPIENALQRALLNVGLTKK